jgi:hypothetical protein
MGLGNSGRISQRRQRKYAVDRGRWKEFVEAPLTPRGIMGKRKKKKKKATGHKLETF